MELIYKEEVYAIVGAAIEVHKILGMGFLEPVYQEALEIEAFSRKLPFMAQPHIQIQYKGRLLQREESQLLNYLKATGHKVGVLINFGSRGKLEWRRFAV